RMPNYVLQSPATAGVPARDDVITTDQPIQLARMIHAGMGVVVFNACTFLSTDNQPTRFVGMVIHDGRIEIDPELRAEFIGRRMSS
ncbi:MAG TPA: hypothetical protein VFS42_04585, partial [Burkholderiaceae bacterium]|nr:hypothetical protein [Burkholderiaceae bacterium]